MGKKKGKQSKQKIEMMGTVTEALKGGHFKLEQFVQERRSTDSVTRQEQERCFQLATK